ncbi:MAG: hypothetical protein ACFFCO_12470, partial [Promethearchaeota archaeon]
MPKFAFRTLVLLFLIVGGFIPNTLGLFLTSGRGTTGDEALDNPGASPLSHGSPDGTPATSAAISSHSPPLPGGEVPSNEGSLNPRPVIQTATYTATQQALRTDSNPAPNMSLFLDQTHGWKGQQIDMSVNDLQRLHVLNGSFETGVNGTNVDGVPGNCGPDGWNETIDDAGGAAAVQRTTYLNESNGMVLVENEGILGVGLYWHKRNAYVLWNQTVTPDPFTQQFYLQFNYRLDRGPLLQKYAGKAYLVVVFDEDNNIQFGDAVYSLDIVSLGQRNTWFDTGRISLNVTLGGSSFNFGIGLFFKADCRPEFPETPEEHARYITVALDNVSLTAATEPYPSAVELQASLPTTGATDITDVAPGQGSQQVSHEYWESNPIPVIFSANTSVIFDCTVILHVILIRNSSFEMDVASEGVYYNTSLGQSVDLTLWTLVSYPSAYEDFGFNVTVPLDWENITVFDSFPFDVTEQCTIGPGFIHVGGSTAAQFGWWKVTLQAPNYARTFATQLFDSATPEWYNATTFWSPNTARVIGSIGSNGDIPNPLVGINATWWLPDYTMWAQRLLSADPAGNFTSPELILGSTNTTAGLWGVRVSWDNGSAVAFDAIEFSLCHLASLTAIFPLI